MAPGSFCEWLLDAKSSLVVDGPLTIRQYFLTANAGSCWVFDIFPERLLDSLQHLLMTYGSLTPGQKFTSL